MTTWIVVIEGNDTTPDEWTRLGPFRSFQRAQALADRLGPTVAGLDDWNVGVVPITGPTPFALREIREAFEEIREEASLI